MAERTHFYRPIRWIEAVKHRDIGGPGQPEDTERAIRMYCASTGASWVLQIRTPVKLESTGRDGKDFIISSAHMRRDDLVALRDACNALLEES